MTEAIKNRIHQEINNVLKTLEEKEIELINLRKEEEKNSKKMQEVYEKVIDSPNKISQTSEATNARLLVFSKKRKEIASFLERVNNTIPIQTVKTEMDFYSHIQQLCASHKIIIKSLLTEIISILKAGSRSYLLNVVHLCCKT